MIHVNEAKFINEVVPVDARSKMRVVVKGAGFAHRALPLVASVGEQSLRGIVIDLDENGFTGFLPAEPLNGDELKVGFADEGAVGTGIRYVRNIS